MPWASRLLNTAILSPGEMSWLGAEIRLPPGVVLPLSASAAERPEVRWHLR